jgi:hypothetical protein
MLFNLIDTAITNPYDEYARSLKLQKKPSFAEGLSHYLTQNFRLKT